MGEPKTIKFVKMKFPQGNQKDLEFMLIKTINQNTFDVFLGMGWDNAYRFKIKFGKEQNQLFQVKGNRFPKQELALLQEKYNAKTF